MEDGCKRKTLATKNMDAGKKKIDNETVHPCQISL